MFTIYNKHTGEEIACEGKEQVKLMLENENFVRSKKEADEDFIAKVPEEPQEIQTRSNRSRSQGPRKR